jgi:hypothetical protein
MVYSNDIIKNVISNIEDSRCRNLFELESEFNDGSRKISELIEVRKKNIRSTCMLTRNTASVNRESIFFLYYLLTKYGI